MVSKRLKGAQEEGEGQGEEGAGLDEGFGGSKKSRKQRRKTQEEEDGLVRVDVGCCVDDLYQTHYAYTDAD